MKRESSYDRSGEQTCHLEKLQTCHLRVHQILTSRALLYFSLRRLGLKKRTCAIQSVTYHHVIDKVMWVSLTSNNELCSRLGESGINYKFYLPYKTFLRFTVNLDKPCCANREVLKVDGLNFRVFLPIHLKQGHCSIVASHLKYGNKLFFSV